MYQSLCKEEQKIIYASFESDWAKARLWKILEIDDELTETKEIFRQNYRKIIEVYKYYSSFCMNGDNWCVNQKSYRQFLNHAELLDTKFLKLTDANQMFDATNYFTSRLNFQISLDKGLLRHEFV